MGKARAIVRKALALGTGALFLGSFLGAASAFAAGYTFGNLPAPFVQNGKVNAVIVVGANAAASDVVGAVTIASALTAAAAGQAVPASSGYVTVGTLQTVSSSALPLLYGEQLSSSPLIAQPLPNATYTYNGAAYIDIQKLNVNSVFVNTSSLGVVVPPAGITWTSYVVKNGTSTSTPVGVGVGMSIYVGNNAYTVVNYTKQGVTFGVMKSFTYVKAGQTVTVGSNSLTFYGATTVASSNTATTEAEIAVNGGTPQLYNLGGTYKVGSVWFTVGPTIITNGSGSYLSSLSVSAGSLTLNYTTSTTYSYSGSVLGPQFSAYNVTVTPLSATNSSLGELTLTYLLPITYPFSLTATSTATVANGLANLSLEPAKASAPIATINVTVGAPRTLNFTYQYAAKTANITYSGNLPGVAYGIVRANLSYALSGGSNTTEVVNGVVEHIITPGEYIYPPSLNKVSEPYLTYTATNVGDTTYYNYSLANQLLAISLPNGRYVGVIINGSATTTGGISAVLNYTDSQATSTTLPGSAIVPYNSTLHGWQFMDDGYYINISNKSQTIEVKGPISSISTIVNGNKVTYGILPSQNGIYVNGIPTNSLKVNATSGSYSEPVATLSFNNGVLTATLLNGETLSIQLGENTTSMDTYFVSPTNQTHTLGNLTVEGNQTTIKAATIGYTLAFNVYQKVVGQQNVSVGQTIPAGVELLGISGVAKLTPANLYTSSPANIVALDNAFSPSTATTPVIIVGGPAINSMAALLLTGSTNLINATQFTQLTGAGQGESVIEIFNNDKYFNNQTVMLVAGYLAPDTLQASEVLAQALIGQPVVSIPANATKVVLRTGATLTGVTVVSS